MVENATGRKHSEQLLQPDFTDVAINVNLGKFKDLPEGVT